MLKSRKYLFTSVIIFEMFLVMRLLSKHIDMVCLCNVLCDIADKNMYLYSKNPF